MERKTWLTFCFARLGSAIFTECCCSRDDSRSLVYSRHEPGVTRQNSSRDLHHQRDNNSTRGGQGLRQKRRRRRAGIRTRTYSRSRECRPMEQSHGIFNDGIRSRSTWQSGPTAFTVVENGTGCSLIFNFSFFFHFILFYSKFSSREFFSKKFMLHKNTSRFIWNGSIFTRWVIPQLILTLFCTRDGLSFSLLPLSELSLYFYLSLSIFRWLSIILQDSKTDFWAPRGNSSLFFIIRWFRFEESLEKLWNSLKFVGLWRLCHLK